MTFLLHAMPALHQNGAGAADMWQNAGKDSVLQQRASMTLIAITILLCTIHCGGLHLRAFALSGSKSHLIQQQHKQGLW